MTILYILIPMALFLSGMGVLAFLWALQHGELDDLETNAWRMLVDEERTNKKTKPN